MFNFSTKNKIIILAAISQLIQQLIANMTVIALPDIIIDLNFNAGNILWVNLIYLCALVAFCIPFAKIISWYGIKKSIRYSLLALLLSVLLSVFCMDQYMLLLSRFIQGLTSASLSISIYMMVVENLSEQDIGSALGIVGSAGYIGMLIAPSFMGFMILLSNWRMAFLILIPIIALQFILLKNISFKTSNDERSIDFVGSIIYIIMMVLFTFGLESIDEYGSILVIISLFILVLFIRYERKIENPIYNLRLFKNFNYVIGNYAAMITYFSITIAVTALSLYLQYVLDIEEYFVGLILIISPIIMIALAPASGRLSNKKDPRLISGTALFLIFISMMIFAFMDNFSIEIILLGCVLQGTGTGMFSAPNNKYVLTIVDQKDLPDASSLLSTSKEFGKILSTSIFAVILSLFIGNQELGPVHLDTLLFFSIHLMMLICALFALSGSLLLFYSKFKYKFEVNPEILELINRLTPERFKKEDQ